MEYVGVLLAFRIENFEKSDKYKCNPEDPPKLMNISI
jgi:hypothetical protein